MSWNQTPPLHTHTQKFFYSSVCRTISFNSLFESCSLFLFLLGVWLLLYLSFFILEWVCVGPLSGWTGGDLDPVFHSLTFSPLHLICRLFPSSSPLFSVRRMSGDDAVCELLVFPLDGPEARSGMGPSEWEEGQLGFCPSFFDTVCSSSACLCRNAVISWCRLGIGR